MTVNSVIKKIVEYGIRHDLILEEDRVYMNNQYMDIFNVDEYEDGIIDSSDDIDQIIDEAFELAFNSGLVANHNVTERDLFASRLMGVMTMRPSEIVRYFNGFNDIRNATNWFYQYSQDTNYIMTKRVSKNVKWESKTPIGNLMITINRSKPEKDPLEIERAKHMKSSSYPKCLLCKENEGYRGRLNHPGRQNLRTIPMTLNGEAWRLQYSPYVYYNEHAIVLRDDHLPMKFSVDTMERLLDFIDLLPHYFIGSNADLPLVGGSILSHDHYQGGNYHFPIEDAEVTGIFKFEDMEDVSVETIKWPLTTLRVKGKNRMTLVKAVMRIFNQWQEYSDMDYLIQSHTNETPHNTVTPIVRYKNDQYECDIVLRNNRKSDQYPHGIFHPHIDKHHIKKENIGLIEVMGLAVLPPRLLEMIDTTKAALESGEKELPSQLSIHQAWYEAISVDYPDTGLEAYVKDEIGKVFGKVLEDAGVFKLTESGQLGLRKFLESLSLKEA